ncbi:hypothetical protein MHBO_002656 [Bonamia ostreae]|uniref:Uncharacterized protein n=1 Tax=Bonamia ostreae TaxID=126728 RepID=A0ABV2AN12_9EUKA
MVDLYKKFVTKNVLPLFEETEFAVQKEPNFRVCFPDNTAIGETGKEQSDKIGLHKDSDYGHPTGEINFIVALTDIFDSNGLFFETFPKSNKFVPLKMGYGQFFQFYGNQCRHYNLLNVTKNTRVSLDFRVVPMSVYDEFNLEKSVHSGRKFVIGDYYVKMIAE